MLVFKLPSNEGSWTGGSARAGTERLTGDSGEVRPACQ